MWRIRRAKTENSPELYRDARPASSLVERHAIIDRPPMTHERASRLRFETRCYVNNTGSARRITIGVKIERKPTRSRVKPRNSLIGSTIAVSCHAWLGIAALAWISLTFFTFFIH